MTWPNSVEEEQESINAQAEAEQAMQADDRNPEWKKLWRGQKKDIERLRKMLLKHGIDFRNGEGSCRLILRRAARPCMT
jgi:hypothetical protein